MSTTATRTEQVQAQDVKQGDLIQMGTDGDRAFYREVFQVEIATYQLTGRRVRITVSDTGPKGEQTMTDLLPFLTLARVAVDDDDFTTRERQVTSRFSTSARA